MSRSLRVANRMVSCLASFKLLTQLDERGALAVAAEDRLGDAAGELVTVDDGQCVGAVLIEADIAATRSVTA